MSLEQQSKEKLTFFVQDSNSGVISKLHQYEIISKRPSLEKFIKKLGYSSIEVSPNYLTHEIDYKLRFQDQVISVAKRAYPNCSEPSALTDFGLTDFCIVTLDSSGKLSIVLHIFCLLLFLFLALFLS